MEENNVKSETFISINMDLIDSSLEKADLIMKKMLNALTAGELMDVSNATVTKTFKEIEISSDLFNNGKDNKT